LQQSAKEWIASASIEPERVNTAAPVFTVAIPRLAASDVRTTFVE
jgi:hypothetical protein